ncbi:MAG: DUF4012 domain-containing protein [Patescibacteria group bacterium]
MERFGYNAKDTLGNDNWQGSNLKPMKRKFLFKKGKHNLALLLLFIVFLYFFLIGPILGVRGKVKVLSASAAQMKQSFSENDIDKLDKSVADFSKKYEDLRKSAKRLYWTSFIPYGSDFKNVIEGGHYAVQAIAKTVESIKPHAELIGFTKGESSFVEKSAEDRLQTAILALDKMLVNYDDIAKNLEEADNRISEIDPNRYPKKFGKTEVRATIANYKNQFIGATNLFVNASPLIKRLPEIFGKDEEKTYLILFQNDKERRATGGFLTSFAIFKMNNGKLTVERSDDIYNLDISIPHPPAPDEILTYHKGVNRFYIRDSNLSPDFVESMKLFNSLYKNSSQAVEYDGVIALDSKVLVDMLKIYGDTEAGGVLFSADEDERCDCPQVIYTLFDIVDRPVNYIKEDRKGILGQLMFVLLQKALGFSPSKYWGTLSQTMYRNLEEKHILLNFVDKDLQSAAERINFAGRITQFEGDYLHVNNVNFAGAKSNLFVQESIETNTTKKSGKIMREVKVTFKNPYPHSDCNLERGGLCLNATLRNWIRVYVPEGSELIEFKGSEKKVQTYDELGKTVFEGFLTVQPLGQSEVTVTYSLPENIDANEYRIMIQKQPGQQTQKLTVNILNKKIFNNIFDVDKIYKANL